MTKKKQIRYGGCYQTDSEWLISPAIFGAIVVGDGNKKKTQKQQTEEYKHWQISGKQTITIFGVHQNGFANNQSKLDHINRRAEKETKSTEITKRSFGLKICCRFERMRCDFVEINEKHCSKYIIIEELSFAFSLSFSISQDMCKQQICLSISLKAAEGK